MTQSLVCPHTVSRVSSVLNRNTQQFGKKHLFDQEEETCWNSDQGPSQWVTLEFPQCIHVSQLQIQFQGGFSSRRGLLEGSRRGDTLNKILEFYPEDNNSLQTFPVPTTVVDQLKVTFKDPTDLFGRVVIYHLRVMGEKVL
ncbi:nuclear receptor 2C2-associated protein isoform X1 [Perognathus longimembris pacificus]|uniref:nuclear receptor 2C2-associated protein isoform X1 n=1 Tax=Perognathus longimembris pacificus TaxID=214514 RepID=UPI002018B5F8|nr:nuclear receptor 2C2-associated protein isoform X1 [Perognathus longimembris pacificus]